MWCPAQQVLFRSFHGGVSESWGWTEPVALHKGLIICKDQGITDILSEGDSFFSYCHFHTPVKSSLSRDLQCWRGKKLLMLSPLSNFGILLSTVAESLMRLLVNYLNFHAHCPLHVIDTMSTTSHGIHDKKATAYTSTFHCFHFN